MSGATRASCDAVAGEYAARLGDELSGKPMDRDWLAGFARRVAGPVADLGCGPGQVTAHLFASGAMDAALRRAGFEVALSGSGACVARGLCPDEEIRN